MRGKLAVIDNVESGFDLRNIDTAEIVQQYKTRAPIARVPKQVLFGENGQVVVGASDHGAIYIFDRRSGAQREVLHHEASGLVQTIAVSEYLRPDQARKLSYLPHRCTTEKTQHLSLAQPLDLRRRYA